MQPPVLIKYGLIQLGDQEEIGHSYKQRELPSYKQHTEHSKKICHTALLARCNKHAVKLKLHLNHKRLPTNKHTNTHTHTQQSEAAEVAGGGGVAVFHAGLNSNKVVCTILQELYIYRCAEDTPSSFTYNNY